MLNGSTYIDRHYTYLGVAFSMRLVEFIDKTYIFYEAKKLNLVFGYFYRVICVHCHISQKVTLPHFIQLGCFL